MKKIVLGLASALFLFFYLSWLALGPAFLPALLGQDHFILAVGEGVSMYPVIHNGDLLVIDPTPEEIHVGEIIVYVSPEGELIGHRVVAITDKGLILKGDNILTNPYPDPWVVTQDDIVGEVEWVIHNPILKEVAKIWFEMYTPNT